MYGTEYQNTNSIVPNSQAKDVPCAVCYVSTRTTLYMMPADHDGAYLSFAERIKMWNSSVSSL